MNAINLEDLLASRARDFSNFVVWNQEALRAYPTAYAACETRIAKAYERIRIRIGERHEGRTVHRCDLVAAWCNLRGINPASTRNALACDGVRHALTVLFENFATRKINVALPRDVYPIYWKIATDHGLAALPFDTFPAFNMESVLSAATKANAQALLLPNPLKLHGRHWTLVEAECVEEWLRNSPERRLIVDGVYHFGLPVDPMINRLIATDQVFYLDSLSKGWLHEQVFGVAIVPNRDLAHYLERFRTLQPSQANLWIAHELLSEHAGFPQQLHLQIETARKSLISTLKSKGIDVATPRLGYFVPVHRKSCDLLQNERVVAIPASVFGSSDLEWSIASALPLWSNG